MARLKTVVTCWMIRGAQTDVGLGWSRDELPLLAATPPISVGDDATNPENKGWRLTLVSRRHTLALIRGKNYEHAILRSPLATNIRTRDVGN